MSRGLAGVQRSGHAIRGGRAQAHHRGRVTRTLLGRRVERALLPVGARLKVIVPWWPNVCRFAGPCWTVGTRLRTGDARGTPACFGRSGLSLAELCQVSRRSAPSAQITASPPGEPRATPLPLSALNYHQTYSSWRNPDFGGGPGSQSRRFWPLLASWPPRFIRAHQLIPMSPHCPCSGASAASAAGCQLS